jgi:hypothetical protein
MACLRACVGEEGLSLDLPFPKSPSCVGWAGATGRGCLDVERGRFTEDTLAFPKT